MTPHEIQLAMNRIQQFISAELDCRERSITQRAFGLVCSMIPASDRDDVEYIREARRALRDADRLAVYLGTNTGAA